MTRVPIVGYEGLFEISEDGRVFSLARTTVRKNGSLYEVKEKELKQQKDAQGYMRIYLNDHAGRKKCWRVHRLVALHFLTFVPNCELVNHKDGNKENNHYLNLEWVTHSENLQHAWDTGLRVVTEKMKEVCRGTELNNARAG